MPINYESAWEHLKQYVSDMEVHSRPYKGNGFKAVLYKMEDLEKECTTDKPEIDLHFTEFSESTPEFESKVKRYLDEWHAYMNNRKKAASSACEAMGMEVD